MSTSNQISVLPFRHLTDFQLQMELESSQLQIKNMLSENGFTEYMQGIKSTYLFDNENGIECRYYDTDEYNISATGFTVRFLHVNIRRLAKNRGHLLAYLSLFKHMPDIIMLSEIGRDGNRYLKFTLPDYDYYYETPLVNAYGGVAILVRKGITQVSEISHLKLNMTCKCSACELENIWLDLSIGTEHYIISCIYRHPNGNVKHFQQELNKSLEKIPSQHICIVAGDLNIDLLKYDNTDVNEYMTQLLSYGFIPKITLPTRITASSKTLIDHIFIKLPLKKVEYSCKAGILYYDVTDHLPVFINLGNCPKTKNTERPLIRIYSERNCQNFKEQLGDINWENTLNQYNSTHDKYDYFVSTFINCFNKSFPLVRISRKRFKDKKWITPPIKGSIRHKERLHKKMLESPNQRNKDAYKRYNHKLSQCITQAEKYYYLRILQANKQSAIKMWKTVGSILNPSKVMKHSNITKLLIDNIELNSDSDISTAFNNFFCTIGEKLRNKIPDKGSFMKHMGPKLQQSIYLTPITENELTKEIKLLNPNKSPGQDNISSKLLLSCYQNIITPLVHILNHSIQTATYPSQMKLAKVLALYKKKERHYPENYRPISLLSCLDNIYEKLLYKRFINFLNKYQILILQQYGFLKDHSTTLALISHIDKIKEYLDKGEYVLGIYLDLKKAFDTVDPHILLCKLEHYGFRGHVLNLIKSYFEGRKQYTVVNNTASCIREINIGVPQGSVLGPLFFLLYINDIVRCLKDEDATLFADDTSTLMHNKDLNILKIKGEHCLFNLNEWLLANKLTLSQEKTVFMIYHSQRKTIGKEYDQLSAGNICIKRVSNVCYLGMTIDECLKWDLHVQSLCNCLTKYFNIFYNIRSIVPTNLKRLLYFAFVHSKISYGIELYGSCRPTLLSKIQVMQNKLLKVLYHKHPRTNTDTLHHELKLLKVQDIFNLSLLKFVYKVQNNEIIRQFHNYFHPRHTIHSHNTRNRNQIITQRPKTSFGVTMIANQAANLWNLNVTAEDKFRSIHVFKRVMISKLMQRYNIE